MSSRHGSGHHPLNEWPILSIKEAVHKLHEATTSPSAPQTLDISLLFSARLEIPLGQSTCSLALQILILNICISKPCTSLSIFVHVYRKASPKHFSTTCCFPPFVLENMFRPLQATQVDFFLVLQIFNILLNKTKTNLNRVQNVAPNALCVTSAKSSVPCPSSRAAPFFAHSSSSSPRVARVLSRRQLHDLLSPTSACVSTSFQKNPHASIQHGWHQRNITSLR